MTEDTLLFYIGKSTNENIVVYKWDNKIKNVYAHWINIKNGKEVSREGLTFLERHSAYGFNFNLINKGTLLGILEIVSFKKLIIRIEKHTRGIVPIITLNDNSYRLLNIRVIIKENTFIPKIENLELNIININTGKTLTTIINDIP